MISWHTLASARAPDGGLLTLSQRGHDFAVGIDNQQLMASGDHASEEALARLACERIAGRDAPRVLVGGLGLGYTLRAAIDALPPSARVVVAELVPAVVTWNRGPVGHLAGHPLDDPRVSVEVGDVLELVRDASGQYDAVLLDVDNGPNGLVRKDNEVLYAPPGLAALNRVLRPAGVLAIWSAAPDRAFERRLHKAGFSVTTRRIKSHRLFLAETAIGM